MQCRARRSPAARRMESTIGVGAKAAAEHAVTLDTGIEAYGHTGIQAEELHHSSVNGPEPPWLKRQGEACR